MPTPKDVLTPTSANPAAKEAAAAAAKKVEVKALVKSGKMKGRKVTVLLDADDVVKEQVGGFVNFIREHAVVGLAIGFIIGQQAQVTIKQLVDSFIAPVLVLIFGDSLQKLEFSIGNAPFKYGMFIYVLVNLIFVLATIYALIKILKLDKLDKPKDKPADTTPAKTDTNPKAGTAAAAKAVKASKEATTKKK